MMHENDSESLKTIDILNGPDGIRRLIERDLPRIEAAVRRRVGRELMRRTTVEDLVQEACIEAWRFQEKFEYRGTGSFLRWFLEIAINCVRGHGRKANAEKRQGEAREADIAEPPTGSKIAGATPTPSAHARERELNELIQSFCDALPEREREIFSHRHDLQWEYATIANAMGIKESSVRATWFRTITKLDGFLKKRGFEGRPSEHEI